MLKLPNGATATRTDDGSAITWTVKIPGHDEFTVLNSDWVRRSRVSNHSIPQLITDLRHKRID